MQTSCRPTGDVSLLLKDIPFPQRDGGHTAAIVIELICFSSTLVALAVFVFLVFKTSETATLEFFFTGVFAIGAMLVAIAVSASKYPITIQSPLLFLLFFCFFFCVLFLCLDVATQFCGSWFRRLTQSAKLECGSPRSESV